MCKVIEDMIMEERAEERAEERMKIAKKLLLGGICTLENFAECIGLSEEEVRKLQANLGA